MFAPWRSHNPVRKTWVSDYWKIIHWFYSFFWITLSPIGWNAVCRKYTYINIYILPNGPFAPNNFFSAKNSKVTFIKTKSATIAFFLLLLSFFSLFLFPLSSSFVNWFSELLGLKKPAFWHLCTQMTVTENFVRLVFKKMVRYISCYKTP